MPQQKTRIEGRARRWLRIGGAVLALAAVLCVAVLGWRFRRSIPVRRVVVEGAARAVPDSLARLARADTGRALYQLQPRLVADRVQRHPWVRSAAASRRPDGTLRIAVTERTPAALVLHESGDVAGEAAYYLDAEGYPLPLAEGAAFDVPLVRGLGEAFQPLRPTAHAALRGLLAALAENAEAEVLVSEIRVGEGEALRLRTVPGGRSRSAEVRLGTGAFPKKLRRLTAFWQQAVRQKPRTAFRQIDLRFDGQIVARQQTFSSTKSSD